VGRSCGSGGCVLCVRLPRCSGVGKPGALEKMQANVRRPQRGCARQSDCSHGRAFVQGRAGQACARNQIIARLQYGKGEVSEACVRVIDSAAQSQYSSVDPRHSRGTVNGFTLHALRIAACRPPGHSQLRRLAGRSQPGPVLADFTHARHCKAWHVSLLHCCAATLLSAQHQACLQRTHQSTPVRCTKVGGSPADRRRKSSLSSIGQFSFSEHDICKGQHSKFPEDIHNPCYRPPQYYKRPSITVRIGWQRPIEPVAPKPSPQGPVLRYHPSIKTSTSALKFSTPEVPSCRSYIITGF
jgi:hypothetical protein